MCAPDEHQIGAGLVQDWSVIDIGLASDWDQIGMDWYPIGAGFSSDWNGSVKDRGAASLALNCPPLRLEGSPHSTLTQLSSDWRLPMPIRANPMSIVCQSSFDDCLWLWCEKEATWLADRQWVGINISRIVEGWMFMPRIGRLSCNWQIGLGPYWLF